MNAYDLRAAAALSDAAYYNQASEMDERLAPFGWQVHDDIQRGSNRALICYNDILGAAAVVFRGSTTRQNWVQTLDVRLTDDGAHSGFTQAYEELRVEVRARLEALLDHEAYRTVVVTGHSLGGALACLCAMKLHTPSRIDVHVITFGQPRVGVVSWARMYDILCPNTIRVVHALDDVPLLPGAPFVHVGTLVHVDGRGRITHKVDRWWLRAIQLIRGAFRYPKAGLLDHRLPSYINTIKRINPSWSINT